MHPEQNEQELDSSGPILTGYITNPKMETLKHKWYDASLGGSLCDTHNSTLGLFSCTY